MPEKPEIVKDEKVEMIEIPLSEYLHLKDRMLWLECLENAGVDNWDGFSYAHELFDDEETN